MIWLKRIWYEFFPRSFKVGDEVYCEARGHTGTVTRTQGGHIYKVFVDFGTNGCEEYTSDGRRWSIDTIPSLIHVSEGE